MNQNPQQRADSPAVGFPVCAEQGATCIEIIHEKTEELTLSFFDARR